MFLLFPNTKINRHVLNICLSTAGLLHVLAFLCAHFLFYTTTPPTPMTPSVSVTIAMQKAPIKKRTAAPPPKKKIDECEGPRTKTKTIKHRAETMAKTQEKVVGPPKKNNDQPTRTAPKAPPMKEAIPETPPAQKEAAAESILKNIAEQATPKTEEPRPKEEQEPVDTKNISETLELSELDAFKQQISQCWVMPINASQHIPVLLEVEADPDGNVSSVSVIEPKERATKDVKIAVRNAVRSFNHPDCQKLSLPKDRYDQWKKFRIIFQKSQEAFV